MSNLLENGSHPEISYTYSMSASFPRDGMVKRKTRITAIVLATLEILLTSVSFFGAFLIRRALPLPREIHPLAGYSLLLVLTLVLWMLLAILLDAYHIVEHQENIVGVRKATQQVALGGVVILLALAVFKLDISRSLIGIFLGLNWVVLSVFRVSSKRLRHLMRKKFGGLHSFVVVGTNPEALDIARRIHGHELLGTKLVGIVDAADGKADLEEARKISSNITQLSDLPSLVHDHIIDEIIFAVPKEKLGDLEEMFLLCEEEGVKTRILLNLFPHVISKMQLDWLESKPLLTFSSTPVNEYLLFVKRIIDFFAATLSLVVVSPLIVCVALLVKITSRGPIIFRQVRSGLGGRPFTLYKFRSMIDGAEDQKTALEELNEMDGPVFKLTRDPRCTPLGRILRKLSLDELPQLFNVWKGDMSFVGPRPPLPREVQQYARWQRRRLRMRPGLTCLWILEGRNHLNFDRWMQLDLEYIDNWSLLLDLKIFLRTIPIVLSTRGAL
ncbi:MAG: sugar transferase [Acidobacteriia bacterium]|nr:sugar transferase [Terriglobia bacterium]